MNTLFDYVVAHTDEFVAAVIKSGGYSGHDYDELMKEGFKYNGGPKDIARCKEYLDMKVKEKKLLLDVAENVKNAGHPSTKVVGAGGN